MSMNHSYLPWPGDYQTRARLLGTSTLYEASHLPCATDSDIRPVWEGAFIAGPAYPLECSPGDNLALHLALERVPRGCVLVVGTGSFISGYWGEVLTVAAEAAGVIGLVIDGGVRDIAALRRRGFPVFARGISVKGTVKASLASLGEPFNFAGVQVAQGDLVVADEDGVIILPKANAARTLAEGQARADKEALMMQAIEGGKTTLELMGLVHWRDMQ